MSTKKTISQKKLNKCWVCKKVKTQHGAMCPECEKVFSISTIWSKEPFETLVHHGPMKVKTPNFNPGKKFKIDFYHTPAYPESLKFGNPNVDSVLHRADAIINGEKRDAYGDAKKSLSAVAAKWSIRHGIPITPLQVCQDMIDLKQTSLDHKFDADTILDIAGYTGLADQVKDLPCPVAAMFQNE